MRIQDSLYYQDFSYVIKVGQSIARCRETHLKRLCIRFYLHVDIESRITVMPSSPVDALLQGRSRNTVIINC